MQNCFDDLKRAWESRKGELEARLKALGGAGLFGGGGGYGGMYGGGPAQQYAQLERVSLPRSCCSCCAVELTMI